MIKSLKDFYRIINKSVMLKRLIVRKILDNKKINDNLVLKLESFYEEISSINKSSGKYILTTPDGSSIKLDLKYELEEMKKDILFLRKGEQALVKYIKRKNESFEKEEIQLKKILTKNLNINNFITDRDGTINNYCGLYLSSAQSIYNAVFLYRFVSKRVSKFVIITSAPLEGIYSLSVFPESHVIYSGSKGREYMTTKGTKKGAKISSHKKRILDSITNELKSLITKKDYKKFSLIGSGFQEKFGQITIARQDISNSISKKESESFLETVKSLVEKVDPTKKYLYLEDTGMDIEIILTVDNEKGDGFSKGDGLSFLDKELKLNVKSGINIVAGDTSSDIPMAKESLSKNKNLIPIFVTEDKKLKRKIRSELGNCLFVSNPDTLITILNEQSRI